MIKAYQNGSYVHPKKSHTYENVTFNRKYANQRPNFFFLNFAAFSLASGGWDNETDDAIGGDEDRFRSEVEEDLVGDESVLSQREVAKEELSLLAIGLREASVTVNEEEAAATGISFFLLQRPCASSSTDRSQSSVGSSSSASPTWSSSSSTNF